jgi:hypothetical protein
VLADGAWRYRSAVTAPSNLSGEGAAGMVTSWGSSYGVAFDSVDHWGGEIYLDLEFVP